MMWPGVPERPVKLGGITVSCADADGAVRVLANSAASAIKAVLKAAGNPLWECDYWAVCRPYYDAAKEKLAKTGRIGPRGRHLAKDAFEAAVRDAIRQAAHEELEDALSSFAADERYYAAAAADAVTLRTRQHHAVIRARARTMVTTAVEACAADADWRCALASACGTGACPFAAPELKGVDAVAEPGRILRPPGHVHAGRGFSDAAAVAALAAQVPWQAQVHVGDAEEAAVLDEAAA